MLLNFQLQGHKNKQQFWFFQDLLHFIFISLNICILANQSATIFYSFVVPSTNLQNICINNSIVTLYSDIDISFIVWRFSVVIQIHPLQCGDILKLSFTYRVVLPFNPNTEEISKYNKTKIVINGEVISGKKKMKGIKSYQMTTDAVSECLTS